MPTLQQLIKSCKFDYTDSDITDAHFPDDGSRAKIYILTFGKSVSSEEAINLSDELGLEPATLHETLNWAAEKWNGKDWIAILGSSWQGPDDDRNFPCLDDDAGRRDLRLVGIGDGWGDHWWFSAKKKQPFNRGKIALPKGEKEILIRLNNRKSLDTRKLDTQNSLEDRVTALEEQMNKLRQA